MSLDDKFSTACERIRKFTKRPSDNDMLEVYSLYKQATVGDVNTPMKSDDATLRAKWQAWNGKKGMKSSVAKEKYIAKVGELALKCEK